jgi:hypothetical protein
VPKIMIMPHRAIPANTSYCPVEDWAIAFRRRHRTDAHATCYHILGEDSCQRLAKGVEPENVVLTWVFVDIDQPGHTRFSDPPTSAELGWVQTVANTLEQYQLDWYMTRAGIRGIAPLDPPLSPADYESFCNNLLDRLEGAGLKPDRLSHWTALFRLPYVRREGKDIRPHLESFKGLEANRFLDVSKWVGAGNNVLNTARFVPAISPITHNPTVTGEAVWRTIDWSGLGSLRAKLRAGESLASHGERYVTLTRLIGQVSDRMQQPHPDILMSVFRRSLDTMIAEGSKSAALMERWIYRVAGWDSSTLKDAENWVTAIKRCVKVAPTPTSSPTSSQNPERVRVTRTPLQHYTDKQIATLSCSYANDLQELYNICDRAGSLLGAIRESKRQNSVLLALAETVPKSLQTDAAEAVMRAGMLSGLAHPADIREEMYLDALRNKNGRR